MRILEGIVAARQSVIAIPDATQRRSDERLRQFPFGLR
jgi:hypothetical protein